MTPDTLTAERNGLAADVVRRTEERDAWKERAVGAEDRLTPAEAVQSNGH